MSDEDVKIENVEGQDLIEFIKVFDHELHVYMNKISDFDEIVLGKYKKSEAKENTAPLINVDIRKQKTLTNLAFEEGFFEDFCYSTRRERDMILEKTLNRIKEKLKSN